MCNVKLKIHVAITWLYKGCISNLDWGLRKMQKIKFLVNFCDVLIQVKKILRAKWKLTKLDQQFRGCFI